MQHPAGMLATLGAMVLAALVLTAPAVAAASLARRAWARAPHLAPAYALLGIGLAGLLAFFSWLVSPTVGNVAGWLILVACVTAAVPALRGLKGQFVGRRATSLFSPVLTVVGLVLVTIGMLFLWQDPAEPFISSRIRFSAQLPVDNEIPAMLAARLLAGDDPRVPISGWLSSDRPPLQSGLLVLVRGTTAWLGPDESTQAFATGVVAQVLWVPAAWALCRALGLGHRATGAGLAFTALSGTVLVNTVFTWPKLLSAGLLMAALAIAVDLRGRPGGTAFALPAVAGLTALALLSHGASLFAVPVLGWLLWRARPRTSVRGWASAVAVGAVVYAPWLAYQRWYDPPGDRLLKMHLAGVLEPDGNSFLHDIRVAYADLPLMTIVRYKWENLRFPFATPPWSGVEVGAVPPGLRSTQFFCMTGALGLALVPLAVLGVAALRRRGRAASSTTGVVELLAASLISVVLWALAMFGPATTYVHQGSHVPVLLGCVLPIAWLADRRPTPTALIATTVLLVAQTALLLYVYVPTTEGGTLQRGPLLMMCLGVAAHVASLLFPRSRRARPPHLRDASEGHTMTPSDGAHPGCSPNATTLLRRPLPRVPAPDRTRDRLHEGT